MGLRRDSRDLLPECSEEGCARHAPLQLWTPDGYRVVCTNHYPAADLFAAAARLKEHPDEPRT